jgi:hypothetical protein
MVQRGKVGKLAIASDSEALEGAGSKRRRDGTASAAAAKAAESSGDDRFALSKFQLDERFKKRGTSSEVEAVDVERSDVGDHGYEEGGQELHDLEHDGDGSDGDDSDDGGDDGNYNIDNDETQQDEDKDFADSSNSEGASAKSKKLAKKLKPMSAEELAAFMKATAPPPARRQLLIRLQEQERRGVVYLSRIPPYMKPIKVRGAYPVARLTPTRARRCGICCRSSLRSAAYTSRPRTPP